MSKPRIEKILFLLPAIIATFFGLYWLGLLLLLTTLLSYYLRSKNRLTGFIKNNSFIRYTLLIILIFFTTISFRSFFFDMYSIPSSSMSNTLKTGDIILVDKLSYGPLLPRSGYEIPWLNSLWYLNQDTHKDIGKNVWPYHRLAGYSKIKRNDVMVFKAPWNNYFFIVKRCIGMPGDSLQVKNSFVYCNGRKIPLKATVKMLYKLYYNDFSQIMELPIDNLFFRQVESNGDSNNYFTINMPLAETEKIIDSPCVDSIVPIVKDYDSSRLVFPSVKKIKWSMDNFGPVLVPKRGTKVELNELNFHLYKQIISKFENKKISRKEGQYFIDDNKAKSYIFANNYYFMIGDNRHASEDSRSWGFVPESNIIGRVYIVLFSNKGNFWSRFMKRIE